MRTHHLAVLLLLSGCPLLHVEVAVDEICVTQTGIQVAGSGTDDAVDLDQDFTFDDLTALHDLPPIDGNAQFVRAEITATADLGQIELARLTIASGDPDSTLPTLDAYACDGDCVVDPTALSLTPAARDNVLAYLAGDSLAGTLRLKGHVPKDNWSMDVKVCMTAKLAESVGP